MSIFDIEEEKNEALKIEVTGIDGETWRWQAAIDFLDAAYGT